MKKFALSTLGCFALVVSGFSSPAIAQGSGNAAASAGYDKVLYDQFLDCAALQVLLLGVAENEEEKNQTAARGVAFINAAEALSDKEVNMDAEIPPRRDRLMDLVKKKDPSLTRLAKSCGAIMGIGMSLVKDKK